MTTILVSEQPNDFATPVDHCVPDILAALRVVLALTERSDEDR